MKIKTKKTISLQDWDDLVSETYGRPYSFQQQDGCKDRQRVHILIPDEASDFERDTVPEEVNHPEMGVSFAAWLARDPEQKLSEDEPDEWELDLWWGRNFYPDVQMVANDLYAKGLIPAGEYYIDIDW